jgi:hypothetical protein
MRKNYYTLENGGRPFRVEVNPSENMVNVFINYKFDKYKKLFNTKVFSSKYQEIWIGKSPKNKNSPLSNREYARRFDGNSILIKKSNNTYVFIGDNIFSFKAKAAITEFVSMVGNNAVSYPYAIDQEGTVYLIDENIMITPNLATSKTMSKKIYVDDPYFFYSELEYCLYRYLQKNNKTEFDSIFETANINKFMKKEELFNALGISRITTYKEIVASLI